MSRRDERSNADALNRTNRFNYDAVGRLTATIYNDGTFTTNIFNILGQRTGVRDQANRVWSKNSSGRRKRDENELRAE